MWRWSAPTRGVVFETESPAQTRNHLEADDLGFGKGSAGYSLPVRGSKQGRHGRYAGMGVAGDLPVVETDRVASNRIGRRCSRRCQRRVPALHGGRAHQVCLRAARLDGDVLAGAGDDSGHAFRALEPVPVFLAPRCRWRRRFVASGVPSWKDPNHTSQGISAVP